jgi:hypothetical protein
MVRDGIIPTTSGKATIEVINSLRVTKGHFNSPRVAKPQVVGILALRGRVNTRDFTVYEIQASQKQI